MVFSMIILGGVTRLTRSGLSMVEWKPHGGLPPMSAAEWESEFAKYKQFPEYKLMNQSMTVDEFKFIYFMEWGHRMWGRALGLAFAAPLLYFGARRMLPRRLYGRLGLMLALGGGQGLVGWWMVKSGLEEPADKWREPRVSPYRLTAHLSMATLLYSMLVWTSLDLFRGPGGVRAPSMPLARVAAMAPAISRLRGASVATAAIAAVTLVSGGFVAGNDAGRAFNDFPFFAGNYLPEGMWDTNLQPVYRNFFENTGLVQLQHRALALTTLSAAATTFVLARRPSGLLAVLPRATAAGAHALIGMAGVQVVLGISTLMLYVPVSLGSMHQGGALLLWTFALNLVHATRFGRGGSKQVLARLTKLATK